MKNLEMLRGKHNLSQAQRLYFHMTGTLNLPIQVLVICKKCKHINNQTAPENVISMHRCEVCKSEVERA